MATANAAEPDQELSPSQTVDMGQKGAGSVDADRAALENFVIENKIDSSEHSGQLEPYLNVAPVCRSA
jgi:hypothetical protein